jgi:hypothetical protein
MKSEHSCLIISAEYKNLTGLFTEHEKSNLDDPVQISSSLKILRLCCSGTSISPM